MAVVWTPWDLRRLLIRRVASSYVAWEKLRRMMRMLLVYVWWKDGEVDEKEIKCDWFWEERENRDGRARGIITSPCY